MARVTGPLFSLNASGSVARRLTYRNTPHGFIVSTPPVPRTAPTAAQLAERDSMRAAATAWASLSANDRAIWDTPTTATTRHGFMSFFLEWKTQQVQAGAAPLIPDDYLGTPTRYPLPTPAPPVFVGTFNIHGPRADWQHGIQYNNQKPPRVTHPSGAHWRALALPSPARGTLAAHGAHSRLETISQPPHTRGALRAHGIHGTPRKA